MSRFQFSLRMLLVAVAVAVVGIGAALWRAEASWQAGAIEFLLVAWVVATVAMMSINAKGRAKAFWMGVTTELFGLFSALYQLSVSFRSTA